MSDAEIRNSKKYLDLIIKKARVHFYKPFQIAEILYRDRVIGDINLDEIETYRTKSKKWRDEICEIFIGRSTTSSSKYQDDIFNAVPPKVLAELGKENREKGGIVEAFIYKSFAVKTGQMNSALQYATTHNKTIFDLQEFINLFWHEQGLRRSIDKIFEIIVYSLFDVLVDTIGVEIEVRYDGERVEILIEFEDFAKKVLTLSPDTKSIVLPAKIYRVGVTNAADRGLDMYANFGLAIQIKHLSLTPEQAENIVSSIAADRIVIVCKDAEEPIILSLLTQMGWKSRIQSIIVESELIKWYEKAMRGTYSDLMGDKLIANINHQLVAEFPSSQSNDLTQFIEKRGYTTLVDDLWTVESNGKSQGEIFEIKN